MKQLSLPGQVPLTLPGSTSGTLSIDATLDAGSRGITKFTNNSDVDKIDGFSQ
ncbi:hypothetical protein [Spirosoma sp. KNUC1025]|uniref:hypothetical protein n=1 Tax=Spirosoma sp. KNUC1025 TaxID=2894082 RepID=UPI00386EA8E9|nr:hypothetical protein LN737_22810 [Spirosoma sp. KNUC1025]